MNKILLKEDDDGFLHISKTKPNIFTQLRKETTAENKTSDIRSVIRNDAKHDLEGIDKTIKQYHEKHDNTILCTDNTHKPKENHFYQTVVSNIRSVKYDPEEERSKYSYDKLEKMRKQQ